MLYISTKRHKNISKHLFFQIELFNFATTYAEISHIHNQSPLHIAHASDVQLQWQGEHVKTRDH